MARYESIDEIPPGIQAKMSRFVSSLNDDTFIIRNLPPELTGGVLARYSRAKTGMRLTLANEFLDENGEPSQTKGSQLMDRVLNAFGDESVGELEGAHVGIENVSQLLTKEIEDRRIGLSPIEQSTRYVMYDITDDQGRWRYLRPREIMESDLGKRFEEVNDAAFEAYSAGIQKLTDHFQRKMPREQFKIQVKRGGQKIEVTETQLSTDAEKRQFNNSYNFTIRCAALDIGRCLLPSSTLTHLGIFGNGRGYTKLISHLKSHPLKEAQERGYAIEEALNTEIPTFIKRNKADPRTQEVSRAMSLIADDMFKGLVPNDKFVELVTEPNYLDQVVAAALFPFTNISLGQILEVVAASPEEKKLSVLGTYNGGRKTRFDRSGRALETGYPFTFDLVGGFAEYRDLQRHRMLTQQRQPLTTELGFIMPHEMEEVGLEGKVERVVGMMTDLNSDLKRAGLTNAAQYATLFNHRIRWMMGMNLRELQHLTELRTQPQGHHSYRRMAMEMTDAVLKRHPWAATALEFVNYEDPDNKMSRAKEQARIAGKNLAAGIDSSVDY